MSTEVTDVRSTFPRYAPRFWTRLSGRALPGQTPLYRGTWWSQLAYATTLFIGSIIGILFCVSEGHLYWACIPLLMCFEVSGARYLTVVLHHQAVHHAFTGNKRLDKIVGTLISLFTLTQANEEYQPDHATEHHGQKLATLDDPDLVFLRRLGFRLGAPKEALWRHLLVTLVSPRFHWLFLSARLKSNIWTMRRNNGLPPAAAWSRRALTLVYLSLLITSISVSHVWMYLLWAYLIPIVPVYHVSALLQFLSEHQWARVKAPGESAKLHLARLTAGRFCGEAAPPRSPLTADLFVQWSCWYARMLFVHAPTRAFILVGDLPNHDHHHRDCRSKDWPDASYARQHDIDTGCPSWPEPPTEVWGLREAIDKLFIFWSTLEEPKVQVTV